MLKIFLSGIFMGIADLIPGVSGGSIAFILGIYDDFLNNLRSFISIFRFDVKTFKKTNFKFLTSLISGIIVSLLIFSKVFHFLLSNRIYKSYLFGFFLGVLLASTIFILKKINKLNFHKLLWIFIGIISSYFLHKISIIELDIYFDIKLIIIASLAISAMLLPGISGSYIFMIFGIYPLVIQALANVFYLSSLRIILDLMIGVILGMIVFLKAILWAINKKYFVTISLLFGFMIGSLFCIWPFSNFDNGLRMPNLFLLTDWISIVFVLFGFLFFLKIKIKSSQKTIDV